MRKIVRDEGRQLQALLDEAMRDYLEKKHSGKVRPQVRKAFIEALPRLAAGKLLRRQLIERKLAAAHYALH
jgi:acyl-CoA synthetase (AMP-forming)/AMP-acid ligase II